jgi:hypothetical protein
MFSLITTSVLVGITGIIGVGGGGSYVQVGVAGASVKTALQPARRKANTRIHNERKYPLNLAPECTFIIWLFTPISERIGPKL